MTARTAVRSLLLSPLPWAAALAAATLWAYWSTLRMLAQHWAVDPQYSHGYVVPVFAGLVLWLRRRQLTGASLQANVWGGALLLGGTILRLAGAWFYFDWFDAVSLLPCLGGLCLLLGGRPLLRWAWPAIAFLFFMIPLPYTVELALSGPLQRLATVVSTYCLQTLGLPALAEGNVIVMGSLHVGVDEACSGLGMLFVLLALAIALCLAIHRPFWQKAVLAASAVPVAVLANVARITATAAAYQLSGKGTADFVHDLAGWLMMPLALGMLCMELCFLGRLFLDVPAEEEAPLPLVDLDPPPQRSHPETPKETRTLVPLAVGRPDLH